MDLEIGEELSLKMAVNGREVKVSQMLIKDMMKDRNIEKLKKDLFKKEEEEKIKEQ